MYPRVSHETIKFLSEKKKEGRENNCSCAVATRHTQNWCQALSFPVRRDTKGDRETTLLSA